ncbi:hypothetical protein ACQ4PT_048697 [Festuca glaucescens]
MAEPSETASGLASKDDMGIDDMLQYLQLNEDELDEVVVGEDAIKEYKKEARWMAIGKVLTDCSFGATALFEKMKSIWNLAREPICQEAGENLFIFQMHCLGDWKKVGHQVWAQIHGIPELYRKTEVIDDLSRRIGRVKEVQMSPKLFYEGNYVRLRVRIPLAKPHAFRRSDNH